MALVIRGARVLAGSPPVLRRADVLVEADRIAAVGPGLAGPAGARELDASGRIVLPGLGNAHTHAAIIGQRVAGQIRIYAGLVAEETGLKQFLEVSVLPWLSRCAPWALGRGGNERLYHRYDPSMDTGEGGDIDMNQTGLSFLDADRRGERRALGSIGHE